jgi:alpha-L-fucosidase
MDRYVEYMKGQIKELITNYGPLGILWFDGEWEKAWTYERARDLEAFVRGLQPDIIINNRLGKSRAGMAGMDKGGERVGDYGTPEQEIPPTGFGPGVYWESCMTMNDTWGFKKNDHNWKSATRLVHNLIDCASKGGNYLLNVGPTGEGLIPEPSVERLAAIGRWMKVNSASIYGTSASPFKKLGFEGRCTSKGNRLYLHVFAWPSEGLKLTALKTPVTSARALGGDERLEIKQDGAVWTISKPAQLDPMATVIELTFAGKPEIAGD